MLTFSHPWLLYLLWLIPVWVLLVLAAWRKRRQKLHAFVAAPLAGRLAPALHGARDTWQLVLLALAALLLLVAAAGPRWGAKDIQAFRSGRDIVLLVDVSRSMLVEDVHPSRLARAKADMLDLTEELAPGDRVALFAFRHRPVRVLPFTSDRRFLQQAIQSLSIYSAPAGETDIGIAIQQVLAELAADSPATQAIVLLSDGEDLAQDVPVAIEAAAERAIPFITVGIGSRRGAPVPHPDDPGRPLRQGGEIVLSRLVDDTLEDLAGATGGTYIPIARGGLGRTTLGQLVRRHLRQIEAQTYEMMGVEGAMEQYQWFLLPAILLLGIAGLLSRGRFAPPRLRATACLLLAGGLCCGAAQPTHAASSHRELAYQAQQQHRAEEYHQAASLYAQAAESIRDDQALADRYRLNAAIALIADQQYAEAEERLRGLPPSPAAEAARALTRYQIGAQLEDDSAKALQARAESWRDAAHLLQQLWRDTGNPDARHDLALLAARVPEAEQQALRQQWIEQYADTEESQLAWDLLQQQRDLQQQAKEPLDQHQGEEKIRLAEERAGAWQTLANRYYALADKRRQAGSPQAEVRLEQEQERIRTQAEEIRDLQPPALLPPIESGHPLYDTWKDVATHETLLAETTRQQTKNIAMRQGHKAPPAGATLASMQTEAADLTGLFSERFTPPPDTPEETQGRILELAAYAERLQRLAAEMLRVDNQQEASTVQAEARTILEQIEELLPSPPQQDQSQEESDPDSKEQPDQPDNSAPDNEQSEDEQEASQQPPPEEPQPDDPRPSDEQPDEEQIPLEMEAMLEQVREREREYQERREARIRRTTPPSERDW